MYLFERCVDLRLLDCAGSVGVKKLVCHLLILPYLQLQAVYLVLSGILAAASFLVAGMVFPALLLLRYFAALGIVCVTSLALLVTARIVLPPEYVSAFGVIALVFYSAALWLPLISLLRPKKNSRTLGLTRAFAVGSMLVGVVALFVEPNRLVQRDEHIVLGAWSESARPLRIVHISDLQTVGECEREREAARRVNEYNADFVVVTGDFVAGPFWNTEPAVSSARKFFSELKAKRGVIVIPGHSERPSERREVLEGLDVIYLDNKEHRVKLDDERSVTFFGMAVEHPDFRPLDRPREPGEIRIVASHIPDITTELNEKDVDLHLAGHTHGGQIVVPGFGPPITLSRLPREYARGMRRIGDHWLHVTAGVGMEGAHAPRIRLFCPPEVTRVHIGGSLMPAED